MVRWKFVVVFAGSLLASCQLAGAQSKQDAYLSATLIRVVDGDTIKVQLDSGPITIRLHGIDSPERKQRFGSAATKALRTLVEGELLEIEPVEQSDSYGRMIATVLVRGRDLNAAMVEAGYAWAYRRYLRRIATDQQYCVLEATARAARRGIWSDAPATWQPPWVYRARKRGGTAASPSYVGETAKQCMAAIGRSSGWQAPR